MTTIFRSIMYQLDLFKRPFTLNILAKEKQSTVLGFFLSLIIFFAISFSISQSDMVLRENPNVIEKTISVVNSPFQNIAINSTFVFGIGDINRTGYHDESYVKIEVLSIINFAGTVNYTRFTPITCDSNWNQDLKEFKEFNASNYQCLPPGYNYTIEGNIDQSYYKDLSFILRVCNNLTDGGICKSDEEITKYLHNKIFFIYYPDYSYDIDNYEQPYTYMLKLKIIWIDLKYTDWTGINMKNSIFISDEYFLYSIPKQIILSLVDNLQQFSFAILPGTLKYYNSFINPLSMFYFASSTNIHYISRRYQKIQEVLANVAGLANTLMVIGFILTTFQMKLSLLVQIINNLYISLPKRKKPIINKKSKRQITYNKCDISQSPSIIIEQKQIVTEKDYPKSKFKEPDNLHIKVNFDTSPKSTNIDQKQSISETIFKDPIKSKFKDILNDLKISRVDSQISNNPIEIIKINPNINTENEMILPTEIHTQNAEKTARTERNDKKTTEIQMSNIDINLHPIQPKEIEELFLNRHHKDKFKFNTVTFIKAKLNKIFRKKLSYDQRIILKAEKIFNKERDIVSIMLKLQEIDKLKFILLSPLQLSLFNLLDKPVIHCDDDGFNEENLQIRLSNLIMEKISSSEKQKIIDNYRLLKLEKKSKVDKRLLQLIEDQINLFNI